MTVAALLLAAGASRRFGADDKLLARLGGAALVAHAARSLHLPQVDIRIAVAASDAVAEILRDHDFRVVMVAPGQSLSASLSAGMLAVGRGPVRRAIVALGDMPFLRPGDLAALLALAGDGPASAWHMDAPTPPAVFPASWFPRLAGLSGDRGAGALLRGLAPGRRLHLPSERLRDIDTCADLAEARALARAT